jgi:hypothetical protein
MEHTTDLYKSGLRLRQYQKAFRDTGCEQVLFKPRHQKEQMIDGDDLKIAEGMIKGYHHEVSHNLYKENGKWVDELIPHDSELASMILKNIQDFADEDLFLF